MMICLRRERWGRFLSSFDSFLLDVVRLRYSRTLVPLTRICITAPVFSLCLSCSCGFGFRSLSLFHFLFSRHMLTIEVSIAHLSLPSGKDRWKHVGRKIRVLLRFLERISTAGRVDAAKISKLKKSSLSEETRLGREYGNLL